MPRVTLSRDFRLWLYRDRAHLSWRALEAQPRWRTEWDLQYMALENLADAWHAAQAKKQQRRTEQDQAFHHGFLQRAQAAHGMRA